MGMGSGSHWAPSMFGATGIIEAPLIGQSTGMTLSGADITGYTDPVTGSVYTTFGAGSECTLDTSEPMSGYASIRTSKAQSSLFRANAIGAGSQPFYSMSLARQITVGGPNASGMGMLCGFGIRSGVVAMSGSHSAGGGVFAHYIDTGLILCNGAFAGDVGGFDSVSPHFLELFYDGTNEPYMRIDGSSTAYGGGTTAWPWSINFAAASSMGIFTWHAAHAVQTAHLRAFVGRAGAPPSFAEADKLLRYYKAKYQPPLATLIHCQGDSLTLGTGFGASDAAHTYPGVLASLLSSAGKVAYVKDLGQGGQTTYQISANITANMVANGSHVRRGICFLFGGTNDNITGLTNGVTTSGALQYSSLTAKVPALKAAGWDVVICTVAGGGWEVGAPARTAWKNDANALIIANSCGAAAIVRLDLDSRLSTYPSSGTNYWSDGTHYNDAGYAIVGQAAYDAIVAAGLV